MVSRLLGIGVEHGLELTALSPGLDREQQTAGWEERLPLDPPAMRLLWGLAWAFNCFALSLQEPRFWGQDTRELEMGAGLELGEEVGAPGKWGQDGSGQRGAFADPHLFSSDCSCLLLPWPM